jgi:hypothetical protein
MACRELFTRPSAGTDDPVGAVTIAFALDVRPAVMVA